jgi:hypothetical protein
MELWILLLKHQIEMKLPNSRDNFIRTKQDQKREV